MNKIEEKYNEVPYASKAFEYTNPNKLNAIMQILGFDTAKLEKARILEIGCSYGGNIIPFAVAYKDSKVYGIDISKVQIEKGQEIIKEIGIDNIELYAMDILEYNYEFGEFDYIICHGVYSWVPDIVKEKILDVIRNSLSENGVAHISYNTYPGWKNIEVYRDAMLFRKEFAEKNRGGNMTPYETLGLGKGIVEFIKQSTIQSDSVKYKADKILESDDYYIYHEYYEEFNTPLYLYDFNESLLKKGLFHITDTNLEKSILIEKYKKELESECLDDEIAKEQYLDYIRNTQFRNSIITKIENKDKIKSPNKLYNKDFYNTYVRIKFADYKKDFEKDYMNKLKEIYPSNIKVKDLLKFDNINERDLINSIIFQKLNFKTYSKDIKKSDKIKLNDRYRKYIEYISNDKNKFIEFASSSGELMDLTELDYFTILLFNGERTKEDIVNILKNKYEEKVIVLNNNVDNIDLIIRQYVNDIENIITYFELTK